MVRTARKVVVQAMRVVQSLQGAIKDLFWPRSLHPAVGVEDPDGRRGEPGKKHDGCQGGELRTPHGEAHARQDQENPSQAGDVGDRRSPPQSLSIDDDIHPGLRRLAECKWTRLKSRVR